MAHALAGGRPKLGGTAGVPVHALARGRPKPKKKSPRSERQGPSTLRDSGRYAGRAGPVAARSTPRHCATVFWASGIVLKKASMAPQQGPRSTSRAASLRGCQQARRHVHRVARRLGGGARRCVTAVCRRARRLCHSRRLPPAACTPAGAPFQFRPLAMLAIFRTFAAGPEAMAEGGAQSSLAGATASGRCWWLRTHRRSSCLQCRLLHSVDSPHIRLARLAEPPARLVVRAADLHGSQRTGGQQCWLRFGRTTFALRSSAMHTHARAHHKWCSTGPVLRVRNSTHLALHNLHHVLILQLVPQPAPAGTQRAARAAMASARQSCF